MSGTIGKVLLAAGAILVLLGAWILMSGRLPSWPSWIGRLPGDISIERKNVRLYLPITTSLLISLLLTLVLWLLGRR